MSDFQAGVGRTDPMCSLPSISDPVPPTIRVMFEQLVAGMARMEARMDDYVRRPPSARHTSRPEPDPPDSCPLPRSLEAGSRRPGPAQYSTWDLPPSSRPAPAWDAWGQRFSEPHVHNGRSSWDPPGQRQPAFPPFSAVSVVTPPLPATMACSGRFEGFHPNPNSASGSLRPGFAQQQSSWDLPPTSRGQHSSWDRPAASRSHHAQAPPWGFPPSSLTTTDGDPWGNRFPDHQIQNGHTSWEPQEQRQPASLPIADKPSGLTMKPPRFDGSKVVSVAAAMALAVEFDDPFCCTETTTVHAVAALPHAAIPPPPTAVSLSCSPGEQISEGDAVLEYGKEDGFLEASSLSPMSRHEALGCIQIGADLCQQISDDAVKAIAICCPQRRQLEISGVQDVDVGAMNVLTTHCQNIGGFSKEEDQDYRKFLSVGDSFRYTEGVAYCLMYILSFITKHSPQYAFDPGIPRKQSSSTFFVASWFPP